MMFEHDSAIMLGLNLMMYGSTRTRKTTNSFIKCLNVDVRDGILGKDKWEREYNKVENEAEGEKRSWRWKGTETHMLM